MRCWRTVWAWYRSRSTRAGSASNQVCDYRSKLCANSVHHQASSEPSICAPTKAGGSSSKTSSVALPCSASAPACCFSGKGANKSHIANATACGDPRHSSGRSLSSTCACAQPRQPPARRTLWCSSSRWTASGRTKRRARWRTRKVPPAPPYVSVTNFACVEGQLYLQHICSLCGLLPPDHATTFTHTEWSMERAANGACLIASC